MGNRETTFTKYVSRNRTKLPHWCLKRLETSFLFQIKLDWHSNCKSSFGNRTRRSGKGVRQDQREQYANSFSRPNNNAALVSKFSSAKHLFGRFLFAGLFNGQRPICNGSTNFPIRRRKAPTAIGSSSITNLFNENGQIQNRKFQSF